MQTEEVTCNISADLHVHTTASDGKLAPGQIMARAARLGLTAIGICDHDTVSGIAEAEQAGRRHGIAVIPSLEISSVNEGRELHILGYYPDVNGTTLTSMLAWYRHTRRKQISAMIDRLHESGIDVCECRQWSAEERPWGRPHLARHLVKQGVVMNVRQAFTEYLGRDGSAYVERERPHVTTALRWLIKCGALPVLAHIGSHCDEQLLIEMKQQGLAGLEVYHPDHDYGTQVRLLTLANKHELVVTGGSDYHGPESGGYSELGSVRVPLYLVQALESRHQHVRSETGQQGTD